MIAYTSLRGSAVLLIAMISALVFFQSVHAEEIKANLTPPRFLTQWGTQGSAAGKFERPIGIAVDGDDFVYVSDSGNQRIQKFTAQGKFVLSWGKAGKEVGMLDRPMHLTVAQDGRIYVAEFANDRIQVFDLEGNSLALIGSSGKGKGEFDAPGGVGVDRHGRIFVADLQERQNFWRKL